MNESVRLGWSGLCRVYKYSPPLSFQILSINLQLINFFDQSIPRSIGILTNLSIPGQSVICWRTKNSVNRPLTLLFSRRLLYLLFPLKKKFHLNSLFGNFPCCRFFSVRGRKFPKLVSSEPKTPKRFRNISVRIVQSISGFERTMDRVERSMDLFPMKMFLTDKF